MFKEFHRVSNNIIGLLHLMSRMKNKWFNSIAIISLIALPLQAYAEQKEKKSGLFSLSLTELLKVRVVSASKTKQKVSDAPSIINVITADEIQKIGANSLFDVLSIVPGFTPIRQLKSDRVMVVRGLALKDGVLVLIDGVPVNDAFAGIVLEKG